MDVRSASHARAGLTNLKIENAARGPVFFFATPAYWRMQTVQGERNVIVVQNGNMCALLQRSSFMKWVARIEP